MRTFFRPVAGGLLGLTILAGVACSDSPTIAPAPDDQGSSQGQPTAAPTSQQPAQNTSAPNGELTTAELVKKAEGAIVRIETNGGVGTGFVVAQDGYILTNNHVIENSTGRLATSIRVTLSDGEVVPATVVGADARADLALLKIEKTGLTTLEFAELDDVEIGQDVVAIGYALDLQRGEGPSFSVTRGIVSQKNRAIAETSANILGAVQTDAAINHGNSGGPLLNMFGEVVGVNTALAPDPTTGGTASGIGFAVGSDTAKAVYEQLKANGSVNRGFLGIGPFTSLRPAVAKEEGIPEDEGGLLVEGVTATGPAGAAGLRPGDIITRLGGYDIDSEADLAIALINEQAGKTVALEFYRDGEKQSIDVTLGSPQ